MSKTKAPLWCDKCDKWTTQYDDKRMLHICGRKVYFYTGK